MINRINLNNNNFKSKINHLTKELNNIFKNSNFDIMNMLKNKNIKTRTKQLTFLDVLNYKFQYSFINKTQNDVIDNYKYNNNISCDKTAFYKKENKIPFEYYKSIYDKILILHNYYAKPNKYKIIAVDGTYNNTNLKNNKKLETNLNMGYYDITNKIPISLDLKGEHNKNKEIEALMNKITDNEIDIQNIVLVLDRAYFSYDLMNFLDSKNINFVIRIKNNCSYINNKEKQVNVKKIPEHIRFINYNFNIESKKRLINKKTQEINDYKIIKNIDCYVATNLNEDINDDNIKDIYNSRWQIEEFFKLTKNNYKFSVMREHNKNIEESYNKTYIIIQIICILERIFELVCDDCINYNHEKYNIKINKSSIISGIYVIITDIIFSRLTKTNLLIFFKCYIKLNYCEKNFHNPRTSKIPFTKWYVKGYHNNYDIQQIFDFKNDNNDDNDNNDNDNNKNKLNKNLKVAAKYITFIKIDNNEL